MTHFQIFLCDIQLLLVLTISCLYCSEKFKVKFNFLLFSVNFCNGFFTSLL